MSAHLTQETVEQEFTPYKIDGHGYLFCGDCLGFGRGGEVDHVPSGSQSEPLPIERCDGCHKDPADWPTVAVPCNVEVEHVTCKIF